MQPITWLFDLSLEVFFWNNGIVWYCKGAGLHQSRLTWDGGIGDQRGRSPRARPFHCTSSGTSAQIQLSSGTVESGSPENCCEVEKVLQGITGLTFCHLYWSSECTINAKSLWYLCISYKLLSFVLSCHQMIFYDNHWACKHLSDGSADMVACVKRGANVVPQHLVLH